RSGQMRIYLVRIPRRKGHSIQSIVRLSSTIAGPGHRIQVTSRVGPNGRDLKLPEGSSDRTTESQRGSVNLLSVPSDIGPFGATTIPLTWAEGRASAGKQPERRPRGQDRMGRHDAALFHSGLARKR